MTTQVSGKRSWQMTAVKGWDTTVLVVDDDEYFRALARTILEPGGFEGIEADGMATCLKAIRPRRVDGALRRHRNHERRHRSAGLRHRCLCGADCRLIVGQARGGALWARFRGVKITHIAMMTPAARSSRGPLFRRAASPWRAANLGRSRLFRRPEPAESRLRAELPALQLQTDPLPSFACRALAQVWRTGDCDIDPPDCDPRALVRRCRCWKAREAGRHHFGGCRRQLPRNLRRDGLRGLPGLVSESPYLNRGWRFTSRSKRAVH